MSLSPFFHTFNLVSLGDGILTRGDTCAEPAATLQVLSRTSQGWCRLRPRLPGLAMSMRSWSSRRTWLSIGCQGRVAGAVAQVLWGRGGSGETGKAVCSASPPEAMADAAESEPAVVPHCADGCLSLCHLLAPE